MKVDVELEMIKAVGEGLNTMPNSMYPKEQKDKMIYLEFMLKNMDHTQKAKTKYYINNVLFQIVMCNSTGEALVSQPLPQGQRQFHPSFAQDLYNTGYVG
jgi:hypothetical protein